MYFNNLTAENMNDDGARLLCKAIFATAVKDYTRLVATDDFADASEIERKHLLKEYGSREDILKFIGTELAQNGTDMKTEYVQDKLRKMTKEDANGYLSVLNKNYAAEEQEAEAV